MSCIGCKHYVSRFEECKALAGVLYCPKCKARWNISQRVGCPRCATTSYVSLIELAICQGAKPSRCCPGFVALPPDVRQGSLFDIDDM
jgi:hypothetical protein